MILLAMHWFKARFAGNHGYFPKINPFPLLYPHTPPYDFIEVNKASPKPGVPEWYFSIRENRFIIMSAWVPDSTEVGNQTLLQSRSQQGLGYPPCHPGRPHDRFTSALIRTGVSDWGSEANFKNSYKHGQCSTA